LKAIDATRANINVRKSMTSYIQQLHQQQRRTQRGGTGHNAGSTGTAFGTAVRTIIIDMERAALYGARFRQKFTLGDAIGLHACSLEARACV
jgi:hypothetical protein